MNITTNARAAERLAAKERRRYRLATRTKARTFRNHETRKDYWR